MPVANLDTTNVLLGIIAGVSVLEALVLIVAGIIAYRAYHRTIETIQKLEDDQIRPLVVRVNELVTNVDGVVEEIKDITSLVTRRTEQAAAVVARPVNRAVGIARGVAVALNTFFNHSNHQQERKAWPSAAAPTPGASERSEYYGG